MNSQTFNNLIEVRQALRKVIGYCLKRDLPHENETDLLRTVDEHIAEIVERNPVLPS